MTTVAMGNLQQYYLGGGVGRVVVLGGDVLAKNKQLTKTMRFCSLHASAKRFDKYRISLSVALQINEAFLMTWIEDGSSERALLSYCLPGSTGLCL